MRIAALSDIHGNLAALDAVLADLKLRGADMIVNLGDILSGPILPRTTAERLMELDLPTIQGNHERQILHDDLATMGASDRFAAEAITTAQRTWLGALPATRWATDEVFMCHATPQNDVDCFLENIRGGELIPAPLAQIQERAQTCNAPLILCGHTHIPRVSQLTNGQMIVNPGSVGIQAYQGHHPIPHVVEIGSPHARYAIVERTAAGWSAALIAIPYDWESAASTAERNGKPVWGRALRTGFI